MRTTTVEQVARDIGGQLVGDSRREVGPDVVIDSRKACPGSLFVAFRGQRVDGHDFTDAAARSGAAAVLAEHVTDADLPHIIVPDPQQGLARLAASVVSQERSRGMIAIDLTGSSGKTSTKDLLAQVLEDEGPTVSPIGSFNNEIGVPLTACAVERDTAFLVSEMGARGSGHISRLTNVVPPDVAMVLNVGTAHLGEFGSRDAIARAKGEILEALRPDCWAVLNAADPRVAAMTERTGANVAWFGVGEEHRHTEAEIEVWATDLAADDLDRYTFKIHLRIEGRHSAHRVSLRTMGEHQVSNAVAAAAAASCALTRASNRKADPERIARSLSQATTRSPLRMQIEERSDGLVLVNDCYNANPDSMAAALRTVGDILTRRADSDPRTRGVAVLGDMLELGEQSAQRHRDVGGLAVGRGFDEILCIGQYAEDLAAGAISAGGRARVVTADEAADAVGWSGHDVVLVKASRGLELERVSERILADDVHEQGDQQ